MCNMIDYVKEHGDNSFDVRPFCAVDALVLSQLAYLHWENFVPGLKDRKKIRLKEFYVGKGCREEFKTLYRNSGYDRENRRLLYVVSKSRRFSQIELEFFEEECDYTENKQFCGITFRISPRLACVVFRGTDMSMNGWKENFSMLYRYPIPAQECAKNYLEKVARRIPSNLIICGHSKGGNLAVYATAMSRPSVRERIVKVYNFDGPGFQNDFYSTPEFWEIQNRVSKYVVPESYVGLLLYNKGPERMVECNSRGMAQHDAFQWEICSCHLAKSRSFNRNIRADGIKLNDRILALSAPKARVVVDSFFDLSNEGNIQNVNQISGDYVLGVLKNLAENKGLDLASISVMKDMILYMMAGRAKNKKINETYAYKVHKHSKI